MGRLHVRYLEGPQLYECVYCGTHIALLAPRCCTQHFQQG